MVLEIDDYVYKGAERRSGEDRRICIDQRTSIRFDNKGGDRRASSGRRSTDVHLEMWE